MKTLETMCDTHFGPGDVATMEIPFMVPYPSFWWSWGKGISTSSYFLIEHKRLTPTQRTPKPKKDNLATSSNHRGIYPWNRENLWNISVNNRNDSFCEINELNISVIGSSQVCRAKWVGIGWTERSSPSIKVQFFMNILWLHIKILKVEAQNKKYPLFERKPTSS